LSSRIELLCDRFYVLFLPVCYYLSWLLWRGDLRLLLWWRDAQVLGVIDQPVLRERWIGRQGHATTMNGNNIYSRSSCTALKNAYLYVLPRCTSVSLNLPHIICCYLHPDLFLLLLIWKLSPLVTSNGWEWYPVRSCYCIQKISNWWLIVIRKSKSSKSLEGMSSIWFVCLIQVYD
jgi:hypothetical protein